MVPRISRILHGFHGWGHVWVEKNNSTHMSPQGLKFVGRTIETIVTPFLKLKVEVYRQEISLCGLYGLSAVSFETLILPGN